MDNFDKEKDANKSNSTDGLNSELSKNQNADNQDDVQNNSKAALDAFMSGNTQQPVRSKDNFSEPSKNRSKGKKKKRKKKQQNYCIRIRIHVLFYLVNSKGEGK